jgi:predicted nucleic acid-binding Zn ribbon protein
MATTCFHRDTIHTDYHFVISDFSSIFSTDVTSDLKGYILCSENLGERSQSLTVNMLLITYFMFSYPCIYQLFRLCSGNDCLGTHLHRIGIRPDPYCILCSLREPIDRKHLGQCTALFNRSERERYREARTKMMKNWLCSFFITIFCYYSLSLGLLYLLWIVSFSVFMG